eukprot:1003040-Amphidinium_carterae.1
MRKGPNEPNMIVKKSSVAGGRIPVGHKEGAVFPVTTITQADKERKRKQSKDSKALEFTHKRLATLWGHIAAIRTSRQTVSATPPKSASTVRTSQALCAAQ